MTNTPSIAAVILTLNEERSLSRALESVQWCDEIIVLDSGSTDQTKSIASSYSARFITHIQDHPFLITQQRNWAITDCSIESEWILFLDADEVIGERLRKQIIEAISTNYYRAYELAPRYWFFGQWLRHTQSFPNWHPRLLKRGYTLFEGGVWESFSKTNHVGRISEPYEHYAFTNGIDDWLLKHCRYADWESDSALEYLHYKKQESFGTNRMVAQRSLAAIFWPLRPLLKFFHKYIFNRGFMDGWQGLLYCLLISSYELIVLIKILEKRPARTLH